MIEELDPATSTFELETIYRELKQMAFGQLRQLSPGQSLNATALVNEAYLRLMKCSKAAHVESEIWSNKRAFFSAASEAMRCVVIDHYRRKQSLKRGRNRRQSYIDIESIACDHNQLDFLALNEVLYHFELAHPEKAQLVKLRYFVGMTMSECAQTLEISIATAERHWRFARAWLAVRLEERD